MLEAPADDLNESFRSQCKETRASGGQFAKSWI